MNKIAKYFFNQAIAIDQSVNTLFGGDPDETISSRLGKTKIAHGGKIPWSHPIRKIIDAGLDKIDRNHSFDAIEVDEGKDRIFSMNQSIDRDNVA